MKRLGLAAVFIILTWTVILGALFAVNRWLIGPKVLIRGSDQAVSGSVNFGRSELGQTFTADYHQLSEIRFHTAPRRLSKSNKVKLSLYEARSTNGSESRLEKTSKLRLQSVNVYPNAGQDGWHIVRFRPVSLKLGHTYYIKLEVTGSVDGEKIGWSVGPKEQYYYGSGYEGSRRKNRDFLFQVVYVAPLRWLAASFFGNAGIYHPVLSPAILAAVFVLLTVMFSWLFTRSMDFISS